MLEIMDRKAAMEYLNVKSATTFCKLMKDGLPYVRFCKEKRFIKQSVDEFILSNQVRGEM